MTTWVVLALHLHGYPPDHPVLKAAWGFLEDCGAWPEDGVRALHTVHSPVWDTCLSATALLDAGLAPGHPALVKAADWLLTRQADRPGDWAARRPRLSPGGWAFQFHNRTYPDNDDTSEVALALHRVNHPDPTRVDDALGRAVRWCLGMQSRNGGWAAFDVDNTSTLPPGSRSSTSVSSAPTRPPPTSPPMWWRCWPRWAGHATPVPAVPCAGCSGSRRRTVRGTDAGE